MILSCQNIWKSFGAETILRSVSFHIEDQEKAAIVGINGAGKTTLLRLLMGLEAPDRGTMTIRLSPDGPLRTAAVFQEDRHLEGYTALQNLRFATGNRYTAEVLTGFILRLLPEDALKKPVREFSGGMRRRTAILRAILAPSDLVLMDEPFTGLDHETKLSAIRMIREFCDGKLFIAATHAEEDPKLLGAKVIRL